MIDGVPMVATAGWTETSGTSLWDVAALYPDARHLLVTDIGRDGMLSGPNLDLLDEAVERLPRPRGPGVGRRLVARRSARPAAPPARSSARRCGKAASTLAEATRPCRRVGSSPASTCSDGRVVKGVQFRDHRDVGDIVEQAMRYRDEGADELVFYDITASAEGRSLDPAWVRADRAGDRHSLRRRRRHPHPRPGRRLPRRRRRQGLDQLARARAARR